jgi:hypothetical protein
MKGEGNSKKIQKGGFLLGHKRREHNEVPPFPNEFLRIMSKQENPEEEEKL